MNRAKSWRSAAWVFLPVLSLVFSAVTFFFAASEVNHTRGDFCSYLAEMRQVTLLLPQVPARRMAERNDLITAQHLGC